MIQLRSFFVSLLTILALLGTTVQTQAAIYDAASDFSPSSNPNGVWTFGSELTLGGAFTTYVAPFSSGAFDFWSATNGGLPTVFHNSTGTTQSSGTVTLLGNELGLHPGSAGQFSVVRFTTPTTGSYAIIGSFGGRDSGGTTTDTHILLNDSTSLYSSNATGYLTAFPFGGALTLTAGDTVDFVVGYGSNSTYFNDSTSLSATLSNTVAPVPEPASMMIWGGLGIASLIAGYRRKRNQAV